MMDILKLDKGELRSLLKAKRAALSPSRRAEAEQALYAQLLPQLSSFKRILSFCSFQSEINMERLNYHLAHTGRLYLPKMDTSHLRLFRVYNLHTELLVHPWGLAEPNPTLCTEIYPSELEAILVPGLGFDHSRHRLGYGRGQYDRLLASLPHALTLGLGFKEQLISPLPREPHDIALRGIFLF
jgi:5-formyltetrahydrofolate cyclo-ligase